jgi:transposase
MLALADMSRDELIALVRVRDERIAALAGQVVELVAANEVLAARLAKVEHLLSRNSSNSSSPPSKDDGPGRTPLRAEKRRGDGLPPRSRVRGAVGSNLEWTEVPDDPSGPVPEGACECGAELAGARDLG